MRLAVSKDGKSFGEPKIVTTPKDFMEGMRLFERLARELLGDAKPEAVAGGIAGPLDGEHTMLVSSPHLSSWTGEPLKRELEKRFGMPVYLENDAAIVGLGEVIHGAGRGYDIVVYITVSTGVGGARFVDGKIDRNAMGFEPGHQIIDMNGAVCPGCKKKGYLGRYVSGAAVEQRFGKHPAEITDEKTWEELARWLAVGLNNSIVHWSPNIVVLGGSMMLKSPGISIERVKVHLEKINHIFPKLPILKTAELKDLGGLYGALVLAKQHV